MLTLSVVVAASFHAFMLAQAELPPDYPSVPMRGIDNGSVRMPLVGIGTWLYNDTVAYQAVQTAFAAGYRHVDTAKSYGNQAGVGNALKASGLERHEYFITSKIPGAVNDSAFATTRALDECLELLQQDYVDLMLIHWPGKTRRSRQNQWLALEAWARAGRARAIGISHYCRTHVEEILEVATMPIALTQEQYHVGMGKDTQAKLHDKAYTDSQGILYMGYSTLCGPCPAPHNHELINGELVSAVGAPLNKTGAQIALRWAVQQGIPVIPKSNNPKHIASNFELFDFVIPDEGMQTLTAATSPPETGTSQRPDDAQDCKQR
jgi:2,5-diketo-D-gluconate reductase A